MKRFVFAIIEDNAYDIDDTFDDEKRAIELAISGHTVAVLDALSLEYYGCI